MNLNESLFSDRFATSVYGERFLNDSKGRFDEYSEVSTQYDPQGSISHIDVPYTFLSPERCIVLQASPKRELLDWVKTDRGYKFFWHPDVARRELAQHGTVRAQPTSSTRTLLLQQEPRVYVKTDLDKKHFRFIRRLQRSSVEHSLAICADLRQMTNLPSVLPRYAFLPESLGIVVSGGDHEGSGVIFREVKPYPEIGENRLLLPYHSLYAIDPFEPKDEPLLVQIVRRHGANDPIRYFVVEIVGPLLQAWVGLVSQRGLLLELHGQNALAELDEKFQLRRVVHRDFQGTYSDSTIRAKNGLSLFTKHVVGTEPGTSIESQYSHVFDGMIGRYLISRLIKAFCAHFVVAQEEVRMAIREYHRSIPGWDVARFSPTTYRFAVSASQQIGNEVELANTGEKPEFR